MSIELRPVTENDIRTFALWRYEPPYDVYNITDNPDEAVVYFLQPDIHCSTLLDGEEVIGFCTFGHDAQVPGGDYDEGGLDIGLGVKPDRTGSGNGDRYVAQVVEHAIASFPPQQLRVTIAAGNQRAIRVWSKAGFEQISRFETPRVMMGSREFAILVRPKNP